MTEPTSEQIRAAIGQIAGAIPELPMASHVDVSDGLATIYSIDGTPIAFMAESVWNDLRTRA